MAARTYAQRIGFRWTTDYARDCASAKELALRAVSVGGQDATALGGAGFALTVFRETVDGDALVDRALQPNPNLAWVRHSSGFAKALVREPAEAVARATEAMRLSPQDPHQFGMQAVAAVGEYLLGNYDYAYRRGEASLRGRPNFLFGASITAASAAMSSRTEDAARVIARVRETNPQLTLSAPENRLFFHRREDAERWAEGLRLTGLPE